MLRKSGTGRHRSGIWQRCSTLRALRQIHARMLVVGFLSDTSALRELLFASAVAIPFAIHYALKLFDQIPQPDLFMWNTIIRGASHSPTPLDAISLYALMARRGTKPNSLTFPFLLRACSKLSSPFAGAQFHGKIVRIGLGSDAFTRNALINMHANCGDLAMASALFDETARRDVVAWSALIAGYARRGELGVARQLFDETPTKDLVSWNVMITAYVKQGEMERARELFDRVPKKDVVSWNAMIAGYVRRGSHAKAMEVFEEMVAAGERPDPVTMLTLVSACADSGALQIGEKIHRSLSGPDVVLGNALIDMYAKCGSIKRAMEVFRDMRERDVSSWNSIIGGLAFHGYGEESIAVFEKMRKEKVKPDEITFVGVLVACSHAGMVTEGREYFNLMSDEYGIKPNIKHYGCIVDMLGRAGLLEEAFEVVEKMEIEPSPIVWRTLLGACRVHGNAKLGEIANGELLKLRRDASGDYVLLSNIYASMGRWGGVERVRRLMDDRGVVKEAGCAVVDGQKKEFMHLLLHQKPDLNSMENIAA